jgi:hypothetical protein
MNSLLALVICASIGWQAKLDLAYDDNIFEYSPSDIDGFRLRTAPNRYPFRSVDDLGATAGFNLTWRFRSLRRPAVLELRARLRQQFSNWERSWGTLALDATQGLWPDARLTAGYLYLPEYLIRYYRDPALGASADYVACSFAEHLAGIRLRQRFGNFALTPGFRYEIDDYRPTFGYYDTRAIRPGIGLDWQVGRGSTVGLDYELKLASARGPVPDISYRQHAAGIRLRTSPTRHDRLRFDAAYRFAHRRFTTTNSPGLDPAHAGRTDITESVDLELRYRLGSPVLVCGYGFEWRETDAPASDRIDDVKDYRANRVRLGIELDSRKEVTP